MHPCARKHINTFGMHEQKRTHEKHHTSQRTKLQVTDVVLDVDTRWDDR